MCSRFKNEYWPSIKLEIIINLLERYKRARFLSTLIELMVESSFMMLPFTVGYTIGKGF